MFSFDGFLRGTHRILMRKSRFSSRRPEDNFKENFRDIVVKFGSERNGLIIVLI